MDYKKILASLAISTTVMLSVTGCLYQGTTVKNIDTSKTTITTQQKSTQEILQTQKADQAIRTVSGLEFTNAIFDALGKGRGLSPTEKIQMYFAKGYLQPQTLSGDITRLNAAKIIASEIGVDFSLVHKTQENSFNDTLNLEPIDQVYIATVYNERIMVPITARGNVSRDFRPNEKLTQTEFMEILANLKMWKNDPINFVSQYNTQRSLTGKSVLQIAQELQQAQQEKEQQTQKQAQQGTQQEKEQQTKPSQPVQQTQPSTTNKTTSKSTTSSTSSTSKSSTSNTSSASSTPSTSKSSTSSKSKSGTSTSNTSSTSSTSSTRKSSTSSKSKSGTSTSNTSSTSSTTSSNEEYMRMYIGGTGYVNVDVSDVGVINGKIYVKADHNDKSGQFTDGKAYAVGSNFNKKAFILNADGPSKRATFYAVDRDTYYDVLRKAGLDVEAMMKEEEGVDWYWGKYIKKFGFRKVGKATATNSAFVEELLENETYYELCTASNMAFDQPGAEANAYNNILFFCKSLGLGERSAKEIIKAFKVNDGMVSHIVINVEGKTILVNGGSVKVYK